MLEAVVKTLLASVIIAFFIISCLKCISVAVSEGVFYSRHSSGLNKIKNDTVCSCTGDDCLIVSTPALINGEPVRVCAIA